MLFIEDVNERPYRLDRMLTQLTLSGLLRRAAGLVFGEMRGCDEPGGWITARAMSIEAATREFPGPVLYGFPSGHTTRPVLDAAARRPGSRGHGAATRRHRGGCASCVNNGFISSASAAPRWPRWRRCSSGADTTCGAPIRMSTRR